MYRITCFQNTLVGPVILGINNPICYPGSTDCLKDAHSDIFIMKKLTKGTVYRFDIVAV